MQESLNRFRFYRAAARCDKLLSKIFRAEHCLPIHAALKNRALWCSGYVRAADLLMAKLKGKPYESRDSLRSKLTTSYSQLTGNLKDLTVALVTEGGLVPERKP